MNKDIDPENYGVTLELFLEWRSPRYGNENPTQLNNNVWEWLIRTRLNAYQATKKLKGPSPFDEGPTWCFERFGQSITKLQDGRKILIAGEHEDHYDPDFYIYNDVVVINPDDSIEIYGYPKDVFPPTDFHSATLVDNSIIIIGNLGYPEQRKVGETQVYQLNLETYQVSKVDNTGDCPGWISRHIALLSTNNNFINISKGMIDLGEKKPYVENIDEWSLNLENWHWERLTKCHWQRWEIRRCDNRSHSLWRLSSALFDREMRWEAELIKEIAELTKNLGKEPDLDLYETLYSPDIPHEKIPKVEPQESQDNDEDNIENISDDEYRTERIKVNDVIVRYVDQSHSVQITIEGILPVEITGLIKTDFFKKFSLLENTECIIEDIGNK